jgi:hypothetical protein
MSTSIRLGTVVGTGAAINVSVGFKPEYIKVVNITDGTQVDEWFTGMADGASIQTNLAVAPRAANGLTPNDGNNAVAKGFTIGSGISTAGKTLAWIAKRTLP